MVEEVGELELWDELPEGNLQESGGVKKMRMCVSPLGWCPSFPLYSIQGQGIYKEECSPNRGIMSLREEPS
jgi:hypothetical protein